MLDIKEDVIMKSVLFHYSRSAEKRVRILKTIDSYSKRNKPVFASMMAKKFGMSHVAMKKHVDTLVQYKYLGIINAGGKPSYLRLTGKGEQALREFAN